MTRSGTSLLETVRRELESWLPPDPHQAALRQRYLDLLDQQGVAAVHRDGPGGEHLTASCMVFDETRQHVLLTHHRKGGFWVQFGGHLEPDDGSLAAAATRELREESGIASVALSDPRPAELHLHGLGDVFGSCRAHFDVVFVTTLPLETRPATSAESLDVAWFPLNQLPDGIVADLPNRLVRLTRHWRPQSGRGLGRDL